jgi:energy-coupling factor transporter ATP-binding protein EcfA2
MGLSNLETIISEMSRAKITIHKPIQPPEPEEESDESFESSVSDSEVSSSLESSEVQEVHEESLKIDQLELLYPDRALILGPSGSGKSTLLRHLVRRYIRSGKLITKNANSVFWFGKNQHEERWLPKGHGYTDISKSKLTEIRKMMKSFPGKHVVIVLDDVLGESFHHDKFYADFISTCRHERVILLIGLQFINAVPPVFRENINRYFVTKANNKTKAALFGLSSEANEWDFKNRLSNFALGSCMLLDLRPGTDQECVRLEFPNLESV